MANALEDNINQLEDEIQAREDFVAAFAHELKTPLTSIIGYADALRSRRLDEEKPVSYTHLDVYKRQPWERWTDI